MWHEQRTVWYRGRGPFRRLTAVRTVVTGFSFASARPVKATSMMLTIMPDDQYGIHLERYVEGRFHSGPLP